MWKYVEAKKFNFLNLRQLNQDALENLFGLIRQHCPTNRNPTCHHFALALKSAILTRLSTPLSRGSNCQQDANDVLFDFQDVVFKSPQQHIISSDAIRSTHIFHANKTIDENLPTIHLEEENIEKDLEEDIEKIFKKFEKQPTIYVSGYLASVLLRDVKCETCITCLKIAEPKPNSIYDYISLKEWWKEKTSLTYPTVKLCQIIDTATHVFEQKIKPSIFANDITCLAKTEFPASIDFSWLCTEHKIIMVDRLLQRLTRNFKCCFQMCLFGLIVINKRFDLITYTIILKPSFICLSTYFGKEYSNGNLIISYRI